jgi:hypothetical protein
MVRNYFSFLEVVIEVDDKLIGYLENNNLIRIIFAHHFQ